MTSMPLSSLRGKWAQGIQPREFTWILKGQLAVCERIGGRGAQHRPIRRQEEAVWIMRNRFDLTISMIPATHNLAAYKELGLAHRHWPVSDGPDHDYVLPLIYEQVWLALHSGKKLLMHRDTVDDVVAGFIGGYLLWANYVDDEMTAVRTVEKLLTRHVGPTGRSMILTVKDLPRQPEFFEIRAAERAAAEAAENAAATDSDLANDESQSAGSTSGSNEA